MIFRQLIEYFKALQLRGGLLTVIGLLPLIVDDILNFYFGLSLNIPTEWAVAFFILAFGLANFCLYMQLKKALSLKFEKFEIESVWLKGVDSNAASIRDTIVIGMQAMASMSSPQTATSVRLFVESVEPSCLKQDMPAKDIEIKLGSATENLENPFRLRGGEIRNVQLTIGIPFSTACIENLRGSLYELKEMTVVVGAERPGSKPICQTVHIDLLEAHRMIEQELATKFRHLQSAHFPRDQFLSMLKRYWLGEQGD